MTGAFYSFMRVLASTRSVGMWEQLVVVPATARRTFWITSLVHLPLMAATYCVLSPATIPSLFERSNWAAISITSYIRMWAVVTISTRVNRLWCIRVAASMRIVITLWLAAMPLVVAAQQVPAATSDGAQLSPEPQSPGPAMERAGVGLLAELGVYSAGVGVRLGVGDAGLELTGGYHLLVASLDRNDRQHIELGSSALFAADLYLTPWHPTTWSSIGINAGYRFDTVLEHGANIRVALLGQLLEELAVQIGIGMQFFPESRARLREHLGLARTDHIDRSSSSVLPYFSAALLWYPWN